MRHSLAICSTNFVQVGKVRDQFFAGGETLEMLSQRRDFFMSNPLKNCPLIKNLSLQEHITFLVKTAFLLKQEGWKTPVYYTSPVSNFPITSLLGVSFRKAGGPEKCGQDLKIF